MKMFDYDPRAQIAERDFAGTGQWTLRAPMLALSSPDPALAFPVGTILQPQLFIRNTTSKSIDASLTFNWRSNTATGKSPASALRLSPNETRGFDVAALQDGKSLPQNAQWASVTLATSGLPGEVMAVAASYDQSMHYGAQTPFSDQLASLWKGSQWEYDPQHDSIITAGNGGTQPTQAAFTIFYNQGTQKYQLEQTLQPGDQMWMDIGKLIRENVPDKNGKTLPADLTSGSYEIRDLTNKAVGSLFEGKVIYDKTYGHVTYGCGGCCGHIPPIVPWYNPIGVLIEAEQDDGVYAWTSCESEYDDVSSTFYGTWSSGSTSIVTVDYYGTHTGVSVGSTTSQASAHLANNGPKTCGNVLRTPSGGANVMPSITSISPAQGLVGTAVSVTIYGAGFTSGATVNAGPNITVSNKNFVSSSQITATFTPTNSTSAGGNQAVTVTVSGAPPSNSENFYIQIPTHLARTSAPGVSPAGPVPPTGIGPLVTGTNISIKYPSGSLYRAYASECGGYQWYTYSAEDQQSNPIANGPLTINESFSGFSPSLDPLSQPQNGSIVLQYPSDSVFGDIYGAFNNAPTCPAASVSDSYNQQFTATVQGVQYNTLTTVIHITRTTNSQGLPTFTSTITTP